MLATQMVQNQNAEIFNDGNEAAVISALSFQFSALSVLSPFRFCILYHGYEDGDEFACFGQQSIQGGIANGTIITKQFEPELGLIQFLSGAFQLGAKLRGRAGAARLPYLSGNRCSRTQELSAKHPDFLAFPRERHEQSNDGRSE
jgi:hypothetical protein